MREKLNDNPLAQAAVVGVLLLAAVVFLMGGMGGKGGEEEGAAEGGGSVAVAAPVEAGSPTDLPPPGTGVGAPPPLPEAVTAAYEAGDTVVLLIVRDGGIDDQQAKDAVEQLGSMARVVTFVVPASRISDYAAIAQGADVNRVPALVVLSPKTVDGGIPQASVHYGYQSFESVEQAVIDAGYEGKTLPYHP